MGFFPGIRNGNRKYCSVRNGYRNLFLSLDQKLKYFQFSELRQENFRCGNSSPNHVSPNTTFHPNYITPKLYFNQTTLIKEFHPIFFILLKHPLPMSYDFRSYLKNPWTDLPLILIGKNKRIVGMFLDWFKKSNLTGSTHMYKYINANCCKSATFCSKSAKPHFI